jgi:hypothetical protein
MPQFRFRIQDIEGRVRTGRLTAASKMDAHSRIEQTGMKVLELTEVLDTAASAPSLKVQGQAKSTYRASRAEPYELDSTWLEWCYAKIPTGVTPNVLFAALAIVGLLWVVYRWDAGSTHARGLPEPTKVPIDITVLGSVSMPGVQDFGDVELIMDFPEIPYQVSKRWSEIDHPSQSRFKWHLEFAAHSLPHNCYLRAHKPHLADAKSQALNLRANLPSFDVNLELTAESRKAKTE